MLLSFSGISIGQITINVKIKNYDGKSRVTYNTTKDGIIPPYFPINTEIVPGLSGVFKIRSINKGYGMTIIFFGGLTYPIFHRENSQIDLVIDQAKIKYPKLKEKDRNRIDHIIDSIRQASITSISGDFSEVSKFYNKAIRPRTSITDVSGSDFSKLILNADTPNKAVAILDSLIQTELNQIAYLNLDINLEKQQDELSSQQIKRFLTTQVYSFYASAFLNGMALKRYKQADRLLKNPESELKIYNPEWERLTEDFIKKADKQIVPASNGYEYNDLIYLIEYTKSEYQNYDLSPPKITNDEMIIVKLLKPTVLDSLKLTDDKAIFAFRLQYLFRFLYTETYYSPALLSAINELKAKYPNSPHIAYFEPQIQKLKSYLKASSSSYDKAEIINTNYLKFNDLLESFKGKNILIDIWATWCSPCISEFKYKSMLQTTIDKGDIALLYISIDKEAWEKKWAENIKYNQLDGYHVLANEILKQDMWETLGGGKGIIPRYALIDKNGKIFLAEASRPSDSNTLLQQIHSMINTN